MRRSSLFLIVSALLFALPLVTFAQGGKPTTVPTTPTPTRSLSGVLGNLQQSTLPAAEACVVYITQANSAALRVGPGTNRSSVAFLPANTEVDVTGRIELDDGSIWYQLDKTQAAPRSAANEIWVAQEDVLEIGDCDRVGETDAPPIIPGAPRSTAVPGGSSGGGGSAPATGAIIPQSGTWRVTYASTANASCSGGPNVSIPTADITGENGFSFSMSVAGDGNSFFDGFDTFRRAAGTNLFEGFWTFSGNENGFIRFNFTASNRATGAGTVNFSISGVPCSATIAFSASR